MRRSILAQLSRLAEMSAPSGALQQHAACSTTSRAAAAQYSTVAAGECCTLVCSCSEFPIHLQHCEPEAKFRLRCRD